MKYAVIGSISHGTLRNEDLIEAFSGHLEVLLDMQQTDSYDPEHKHAKIMMEAQSLGEDFDYDSELASDIVEELSTTLEEYAPPFCYFGATEGDGSDFGFWFNSSEFESACRDGDVLKINDLARVDEVHNCKVKPDWIAVVNDHGNVTIYSYQLKVEWTEVLSVV